MFNRLVWVVRSAINYALYPWLPLLLTPAILVVDVHTDDSKRGGVVIWLSRAYCSAMSAQSASFSDFASVYSLSRLRFPTSPSCA